MLLHTSKPTHALCPLYQWQLPVVVFYSCLRDYLTGVCVGLPRKSDVDLFWQDLAGSAANPHVQFLSAFFRSYLPGCTLDNNRQRKDPGLLYHPIPTPSTQITFQYSHPS